MITIEQVLEVLKRTIILEILSTKSTTTIHGLGWLLIIFLTTVVISHHLPYFCQGAGFKLEFLESAVQAGLGFYVAEKDYQVGIPAILVSDIKQAMSLVAQAFYQHPQDKLKLLAFTGTKGKTTASYLPLTYLSKVISLPCSQPWTRHWTEKPSSNLT